MRNIVPTLKSLGLLESEVKTYLAALELGPSTVLELNKKIGLSRQAIYTAMESLIELGLMSSVEKGKKTLYAAESPERLRSIAEAKLKKMESTVREIKSITSELKLIEKGEKPVVKVFEGTEGVMAIRDEIVKSKPAVIYEFANEDMISAAFTDEDLRPLKEKLDALNIPVKMLSYSSEERGKRASTNRQMIKDDKIKFNGDIVIAGKKVALSAYQDKNIAVLIESQIIADTIQALFQLAWDGNKK